MDVFTHFYSTLLAGMRDLLRPSARGRHRTTQHVATRVISADTIARVRAAGKAMGQ